MSFVFNLRYTLRLLRKSPGTAIIAVFIIALGLAVSASLYGLIKSIAFGSLPFANEGKIVRLMALNEETGLHSGSEFDAYEFQRMQQSLQSFEELAGYESYLGILSDGDVAESFIAAKISPALFSIMPATPVLGRTLLPDDQQAGAEPVVVLSYDAWQSYYAGRLDIVGESSRINGETYTIIGVMPARYSYPEVHELWTPLQLGQNPQPGGSQNIAVMGLLNDVSQFSSADAELATFFSQKREDYVDNYPSNAAKVVPFTKFLADSGGSIIAIGYILSGIAFSILAIVCFNLANLLLIRANERTQELGIRNALGSTKSQLIAELLRESLVICFSGFMLGLLLSSLILRFIDYEFNYLLGTEGGFVMPPWMDFSLTLNVVVVSALITVAIWVSTGFFSAWKLYRKDISSVIHGGATSLLGGSKNRAVQMLVGLEITLSCALLVICGALFFAAYKGTHADFGIAKEQYITGFVELPAASYPDSNSRQSYLNNLQVELSAQSDFVGLTISTALPGMDGEAVAYSVNGGEIDDNVQPRQNMVWISDSFFDLFDVPLREGRHFDGGDNSESSAVVIVDEIFSANAWPGESPLGKRIQVDQDGGAVSLEIVGVTSHIIHDEPMAQQSRFTTLYRPISQSPHNYFSIAARISGNLDSNFAIYSNALKIAAARVDRQIPVTNIHSLDRVISGSMNGNDLLGDLLLGMAFIVFSLAMVALFAVVSRSIFARSKEIGVRRALGSTQIRAIWIFMRQGLNYIAIAIPIGGGVGVLLSARFLQYIADLEGVLISVSVTVLILITLMVLAASYFPARRIVAMEPGDALHYE